MKGRCLCAFSIAAPGSGGGTEVVTALLAALTLPGSLMLIRLNFVVNTAS